MDQIEADSNRFDQQAVAARRSMGADDSGG
jgi:hypothetical protein